MKNLIVLALFLIFSITGYSQESITIDSKVKVSIDCYHCDDGKKIDCKDCGGIVRGLFTGVVLSGRGMKDIALHHPIKVGSVANQIIFEDPYGTKVQIRLSQLRKHQTLNSLYDYLEECFCQGGAAEQQMVEIADSLNTWVTWVDDPANNMATFTTPDGQFINVCTSCGDKLTIQEFTTANGLDSNVVTIIPGDGSTPGPPFIFTDNTNHVEIDADGCLVITSPSGVELSKFCESVTTLVNNISGSYTYINEEGVPTEFCYKLQSSVAGQLQLVDCDGTPISTYNVQLHKDTLKNCLGPQMNVNLVDSLLTIEMCLVYSDGSTECDDKEIIICPDKTVVQFGSLGDCTVQEMTVVTPTIIQFGGLVNCEYTPSEPPAMIVQFGALTTCSTIGSNSTQPIEYNYNQLVGDSLCTTDSQGNVLPNSCAAIGIDNTTYPDSSCQTVNGVIVSCAPICKSVSGQILTDSAMYFVNYTVLGQDTIFAKTDTTTIMYAPGYESAACASNCPSN